MTADEVRQAAGLGTYWQVIWNGPDPNAAVRHHSRGLYAPGGTYAAEWVQIPYAPTGTPGLEVARCERCRIAWGQVKESLDTYGHMAIYLETWTWRSDR